MKGMFIVMEGPDGSGKSTQIELLKEYLNETGRECMITREPGGTVIGEAVRSIILNPEYEETEYEKTEENHEEGNIEEHMMYNTYNMGLGMVLAVDEADVDRTMEAIRAAGESPYVVGRIEAGEKGVDLC